MVKDTVGDLIDYLQTIPRETKVEVVQAIASNWDTFISLQPLDLSKSSYWDYDEKAEILTLGEYD